jgi:hypothetical protein
MRKINEMSEIDLARLAAFVDGEGSLLLEHYLCTKRGHKRWRTTPEVSVSNTDIRLPEWCLRTVGIGAVCKAGTKGPNWKQAYYWACTGRVAIAVARAIYPYLIIKRQQAEVLMSYECLILDRSQTRRGLSPQNQEQRLHLVTKIRALNHRGTKEVAS